MPADTVAAILRRAAERIEKPGAWCQGAGARDECGPVYPWSAYACQWCAIGAIQREGPLASAVAAVRAIESMLGESLDLYNDAPGRTAAEVAALLRKAADESERSEG